MIDELVGFEAPALIPSPEDIDIDVVKSRRRETILN